MTFCVAKDPILWPDLASKRLTLHHWLGHVRLSQNSGVSVPSINLVYLVCLENTGRPRFLFIFVLILWFQFSLIMEELLQNYTSVWQELNPHLHKIFFQDTIDEIYGTLLEPKVFIFICISLIALWYYIERFFKSNFLWLCYFCKHEL